MKTILLISPYWKESHRWMVSSYKLAQLWQTMGYKVVVVCLHSFEGVIEETPTLTVYGVKDIFIKDPFNFGVSLSFYNKVFKYSKKHKPNVVVINKILFWTSWSIIFLRMRGIKPVVLTDALVGVTWWPRAWYMKVLAFWGGHTMGWLTMLLAKQLVFFHPQPPNVLQRMMVQHKSSVIPTGIDVKQFTYGIPHHNGGEPVVITYIGRLESVKGVDDFCRAVYPLTKKYMNIHVQVVGQCEQSHPLVTQFGDSITFTGLREDINIVLSTTDIFVLPSYSEGLSNALMEAMCSGCACIVSRVGGNTFLIEEAESGLTFKPGDIIGLAESLEQLIANYSLREKYAVAARKRIEEHFDWPVVAGKYKELFAKVQS